MRTERRNLVVVGAGPGVGAATARRFAAAGFHLGLVARRPEALTALAGDLRPAVTTSVATAVADLTDTVALRHALDHLADRSGPADVVLFSPLPSIELIKPVLDTDGGDLRAALALSVGAAADLARHVAPSMVERGSGSLLFTTGSGALRPTPDRAASAVATSAQGVYLRLLHEALAPTGVRVAHVTIAGAVGPGLTHEPEAVARALFDAHTGTGDAFPVLS